MSGLSFIELATLVPAGAAAVSVTTKLAAPDAPLPPVAAQARAACRGVLHRDQVDEDDQVSVGCVVDTSVSMASLYASGMVAAAGDIVGRSGGGPLGGQPVALTTRPLRRRGRTLSAVANSVSISDGRRRRDSVTRWM